MAEFVSFSKNVEIIAFFPLGKIMFVYITETDTKLIIGSTESFLHKGLWMIDWDLCK